MQDDKREKESEKERKRGRMFENVSEIERKRFKKK